MNNRRSADPSVRHDRPSQRQRISGSSENRELPGNLLLGVPEGGWQREQAHGTEVCEM